MKSTQFIKNQYLWSGFKEKVEPYLTDEEYKGKMSEYVLPRNMHDTEIQEETKSEPIPVEVFASFLQKTLKDKDKWYLFHVQTPKGIVAVRAIWGGDVWFFDADEFDALGPWDQGGVFLFSATGTEKLKTGPLDTLTLSSLESRISALEATVVNYQLKV